MTYQVFIDGHPTLESEAWEDMSQAAQFAADYNFLHQGLSRATVLSWNPRTEDWVSVA